MVVRVSKGGVKASLHYINLKLNHFFQSSKWRGLNGGIAFPEISVSIFSVISLF